jgi:DNA helicase-2/ATP-dependent DNA helicase PcrA
MARFRLFDLNDAQRAAVKTTEGPLLILAGAGTGKTRVITARAAYLIAQGVGPAEIVAVTFTNKAANEMRERLAGMIPRKQAAEVTMSTFHSLCLRILRSGIERLGYKSNFSIYDEGDQIGLVKKVIAATAARDEKLDFNLARGAISKAKNAGQPLPADSLLEAVGARYDLELKRANAVDFDDLLLLTVRLLREHKDLKQRWQQRYRYLMVDEFQDTNRLQLDFIALLAGKHRNVAVVGDDDQSIYGWRGADISNVLQFEQYFTGPKVITLEQNYRSTSAILSTANGLIKNNPHRRPKNLWSAVGPGENVRIIACPNEREEAQFIAEEIQRRRTRETSRWEDFAVLFRMNAQSRLLEENLRRLQIPYRIIGGKSFFDRREIKDVLAYMTVLINPQDDASILRIINTPARGISAATTEMAVSWSAESNQSLWQALSSPGFQEQVGDRAWSSLQRFVSLVEGYADAVRKTKTDPAEPMRRLLAEIEYVGALRRQCKTREEGEGREENVHDVLRDLSLYGQRSSKGLRGFLDEILLDQEREEEDDAGNQHGVTLITMHAAKGLEFPNVYIAGVEEGILPHDRSKAEGALDEERRLLYVGITRAMRALTITHCRARLRFGSSVTCQPSSFLRELPPEHLEQTNLETLLSTPVSERDAKSGFSELRAALGMS